MWRGIVLKTFKWFSKARINPVSTILSTNESSSEIQKEKVLINCKVKNFFKLL